MGPPAETLERLKKLIQPTLSADDVTVVVVRRELQLPVSVS